MAVDSHNGISNYALFVQSFISLSLSLYKVFHFSGLQVKFDADFYVAKVHLNVKNIGWRENSKFQGELRRDSKVVVGKSTLPEFFSVCLDLGGG